MPKFKSKWEEEDVGTYVFRFTEDWTTYGYDGHSHYYQLAWSVSHVRGFIFQACGTDGSNHDLPQNWFVAHA